MKLGVYVFAALFALTGCASAPIQLELRLDLPDEHIPIALDTVREWEHETPARFWPISITPFGCANGNCEFLNEVPRADLDRDWISGSCNDKSGDGCTIVEADKWQAHSRIASDIPLRGDSIEDKEGKLRLVILHELGHALGLSHDDSVKAPAVMKSSYIFEATHLTEEDVWQFSKLHGGAHL